MADIKISQLSEAQLISDTDVFPMTSNGVTVKVPASVIKDYMDIDEKVSKTEVLIIDIASFSSLPQTVTDANIESDMVVVNSIVGTPAAQVADWTVTTANGSLTISGTNAIKGSTTLTLYLSKSR